MSQRRLAAIMFTDIVGYTALMGRNEDKAFQILRKNREIQRPIIKKYRGEWLKEMGDGILASFTTASDAVRCAGEIQNAVKTVGISLRIGIHEGEVVFDGGDVLGDGVNVASRLEELADEGSIIISGAVYKDIKNKAGITTEFIEEIVLKNVEEPTKVYRVKCEEPDQDVLDKKSLKKKTNKLLYYIIVGLVIVIIAIVLWHFTPSRESAPIVEETESEVVDKSIAVLPFRNISNDPEQDYFSDGMSEEIRNRLSQIEDLRVIASTSSFAFKGKDEDIREIGRKLNVAHLLEGSVRKVENRLRITAQLIKTIDGSNLWSESFDRELDNVSTIFEIQDEISLAIVDKLKVNLLQKEQEAIVQRYTENLVAYNLYLKGRSYSIMMTTDGFKKAIEHFEQALKNDPQYALAYVGLAGVYIGISYWGNVPPNDAYPKAKIFAMKALELDSLLAEAYTVLGTIYLYYEWNFKGAEKQFKRAIKLNPNSAYSHLYYSIYQTLSENHGEAIKEAKFALELDPLSPYYNAQLGQAYFYAHQYDQAIQQLQNTRSMYPDYFLTHLYIGAVYREKLMFKEAKEAYEQALLLSDENPLAMTALVGIYDVLGKKEKAEKLFEKLEQRSKNEYVPPTCFYLYHLHYGNADLAYECLKNAVEVHDVYINWFRILPSDKYRIPDEPRFKDLLKNAGFPP